MRCISLAKELEKRDINIYFICIELEGNFIELVNSKGIKVLIIKNNSLANLMDENEKIYDSFEFQTQDAKATNFLIKDMKTANDLIVVDHYSLNEVWENLLYESVSKIMVIDDLGNRSHSCNILLDQNYLSASKNKYDDLVSDKCKLLLGPKYALLRDEFTCLNVEDFNPPSAIRRILVFFSLGNDRGETLKAIKGIANADNNYIVDVIAGARNIHIKEIEEITKSNRWNFYNQVNNISKLMLECDLMIGGGGSTSWEKCFLGVPSINPILIDNQEEIAETLHDHGAIINLGWYNELDFSDYTNTLNSITDAKLESLSRNAYALVDGKGVQRVSEILLS